MNGKYIVVLLDGDEEIFTFPESVRHDRFWESVQYIRMGSDGNWKREYRDAQVIAAGFVQDGRCSGKSDTLNLESRGNIDTALLHGLHALRAA